MNRRNFLKITAITSIAALVPLEFIVDNRDDETRFMEHIVTHYNELQVLSLIKTYGWISHQGSLLTFFQIWVKRQPEVVKWMKEKLGKPTPTRDMWYAQRRSGKLSIEASLWAEIEYDKLAYKFNLTRSQHFAVRVASYKQDLEEMRLKGYV